MIEPHPLQHMTISLRDAEVTVALRLRRPAGDQFRVDANGDVSVRIPPGVRRYLLPEGVRSRPEHGLDRAQFDFEAGDSLCFDLVAGGDRLPPDSVIHVLLYDRQGRLRERRRQRIDSTRLFFVLRALTEPGRGAVLLQLAGEGELPPLRLNVDTGRPTLARSLTGALEAEDLTRARAGLTLLQQRQPHHPRLTLLTARVAILAGEFSAGADALLRHAARGALKAADYRILISALRKAGRLDEADAAFESLSRLKSPNARALRDWARIAQAGGDVAEMIRRWGVVFDRTGDAKAAEQLISLLDRTERFEEAEARIADGLAGDERSDLALMEVAALRYLNQGRNREALPLLGRLVDRPDGSDPARWRRLLETASMRHGEDGSAPPSAHRASAARKLVRTQLKEVEKQAYYAARGLGEACRLRLARTSTEADHPEVRIAAHWALATLALAGHGGDPAAIIDRLDAIEAQGGWRPGIEALRIRLLAQDGQFDAAGTLLTRAMATPYGNLFLAAANLAGARGDDAAARLAWINRAFALWDLSPITLPRGAELSLDTIAGEVAPTAGGPRVSIIVPMWQAADTIETSLRSLTAQSYRNVEIIVVDDASTDDGPDRVAQMGRADNRIRLLRESVNRGAYHSRNLGLAQATGDLFTCQDADDWSHPERIERQVRRLVQDDSAIGNFSRCIAATSELKFMSRDGAPSVHRWNFSSLMLRRDAVLTKVGYWREARFAADGEYLSRLRSAFGEYAVRKLADGPLAIVRQSSSSLTGHGVHGLTARGWTGRRLYRALYENEHSQGPPAQPLSRNRPPGRSAPAVVRGAATNDDFDLLLASDFRLPGGTTASNVQELIAQSRADLRTGLVQLENLRSRPETPLSTKILKLVDGAAVEFVSPDRIVTARHLVIRWPPCVANYNDAIARVHAPAVSMIVNQTPWRGEVGGEFIYHPAEVDRQIERMFGHRATWRPIGPAVRAAMAPHAEEVAVAEQDWVNILDLDDWGGEPRERRPNAGVPVIGRHGRDFPGKWPMDRDTLLSVYPEDGSMTVAVLGGADVAARVLGREPQGWRVYPFDSIAPADYLRGLDVFVYYPDPGLDEAFGRAIIEAMAAGVPAILPHRFQTLFGGAALYGEPHEARDIVMRLIVDEPLYAARSRAGIAFAEFYSHQLHIARLRALLDRA